MWVSRMKRTQRVISFYERKPNLNCVFQQRRRNEFFSYLNPLRRTRIWARPFFFFVNWIEIEVFSSLIIFNCEWIWIRTVQRELSTKWMIYKDRIVSISRLLQQSSNSIYRIKVYAQSTAICITIVLNCCSFTCFT